MIPSTMTYDDDRMKPLSLQLRWSYKTSKAKKVFLNYQFSSFFFRSARGAYLRDMPFPLEPVSAKGAYLKCDGTNFVWHVL